MEACVLIMAASGVVHRDIDPPDYADPAVLHYARRSLFSIQGREHSIPVHGD